MSKSVLIKVMQRGLGDAVLLSGAIQALRDARHDLRIGVDSAYPEVFENHPAIDPSVTAANADMEIKINAAGICRPARRRKFHFSSGFVASIFNEIGIAHDQERCPPKLFLTEAELSVRATERPYWLLATGGKKQMTTKWYPTEYYQKIADGLRERGFEVVQVGDVSEFHPKLDGSTDLIGKTSVRDLFGIIHNAAGVICPVTSFLHIAAAVPRGAVPIPVVCLMGGREDPHFATYPATKVLHTIGDLDCCRDYGCWAHNCHRPKASIAEKVIEGEEPPMLCTNGVDFSGTLFPKCMTLLTPELVLAQADAIRAGAVSEPTIGPAGNFKRQPRRKRRRPVGKGGRRFRRMNKEKQLAVDLSENKTDNNLEVERQICVVGISRSGNHPIMDWIGSQCSAPVAFRNNLRRRVAQKNGASAFSRTDLLPNVTPPSGRFENLMYSFENIALENARPLDFIEAEQTKMVVVLRDPWNLLASLEALACGGKRNWPCIKRVGLDQGAEGGGLGKFAALWMEYAALALNPPAGVVPVLYNRWKNDAAYRDELFQRLELDKRSDKAMKVVPVNGGGSSFDGHTKRGKAAEMETEERWKTYAGEDWFTGFFESNPDVVEAAEQLFGPKPF